MCKLSFRKVYPFFEYPEFNSTTLTFSITCIRLDPNLSMKDIILLLLFLFKQFFGVPHLVTDFFFLFQSLNEPELGACIDSENQFYAL
jgi:hypothetical protein